MLLAPVEMAWLLPSVMLCAPLAPKGTIQGDQNMHGSFWCKVMHNTYYFCGGSVGGWYHLPTDVIRAIPGIAK